MRQPLLAKAPLRLAIAEQISYPPPVGGWNARDAYSAMGPEDAVILQNWFPGTSAVVTRGGTTSHATGIPGVGKTLATYSAMRNGRRNTWITAIVTLISRPDGWPLAATGQARWS